MNADLRIQDRAPTRDELSSAWRGFLRASEPFIKAKGRIYATVLPKMTVTKRGELPTVEYIFSATQKDALALLDEAIVSIAKAYGVKVLRAAAEDMPR